MNANSMFLCANRTHSPAMGIPVKVTDAARKKYRHPKKHAGGIIVEDLSFRDLLGQTYWVFKVQHANGSSIWSASDLEEIGGVHIEVDENLPNN